MSMPKSRDIQAKMPSPKVILNAFWLVTVKVLNSYDCLLSWNSSVFEQTPPSDSLSTSYMFFPDPACAFCSLEGLYLYNSELLRCIIYVFWL